MNGKTLLTTVAAGSCHIFSFPEQRLLEDWRRCRSWARNCRWGTPGQCCTFYVTFDWNRSTSHIPATLAGLDAFDRRSEGANRERNGFGSDLRAVTGDGGRHSCCLQTEQKTACCHGHNGCTHVVELRRARRRPRPPQAMAYIHCLSPLPLRSVHSRQRSSMNKCSVPSLLSFERNKNFLEQNLETRKET